MILRCKLDDLILLAEFQEGTRRLIAYDGAEGFRMEPMEGVYYEIVGATCEELRRLQYARFRLLRPAPDFEYIEEPGPEIVAT